MVATQAPPKKLTTPKAIPPTTPTTTQRPIPPYTLVCTYGAGIKAASAFPEDGFCDFIVLEEMPSSVPQDFAEPFPPGVQHFVDTAAKYKKTEFVAAFDFRVRSETDKASRDPSVKGHLHALFAKRIFHYGYINTDTYTFSTDQMIHLMRILKRLTDYLEDKKTPDRPIYTFMASTWSEPYDEVSAKSVAEIARTIRMPDMFISKAHISEDDSQYEDCRILPPNLLKRPRHLKEFFAYFYTLYTALKHISDLDNLRDQGIKTAALSVSVGLYGRWYNVETDADGGVKNYAPGNPCFAAFIKQQKSSIATGCDPLKNADVEESKDWSCSYVLDNNRAMTFAYDTPTTITYKLCISRKNVSGLPYGITVAGLEYSDAANLCELGKFPVLTAVRNTLMFFKNNYNSPHDYEKCLSSRRSAEEGPTNDDQ